MTILRVNREGEKKDQKNRKDYKIHMGPKE